ncbi:MAG TPA: Panacea domain-containing protein [Burkholderiaceae bacterium]|jgi:uncharacterized phage-associated protein|nr:Panacea domain-containing protein [Burkholderiaceae bacterium]
MLKELFNEKKAAQVAAFFLIQAKTPLEILKLMKLMYLAERGSFANFGEGMMGDRLVSMPHGPVLSITHNFMNGELTSSQGGWDTWIADREARFLSLSDEKSLANVDELLELCDADIQVLNSVWQQFGLMTAWQLREYTHDHCPEWQDPDGSMIPMKPEDLFNALNFSPEQSAAYLGRMKQQAAINAAHINLNH